VRYEHPPIASLLIGAAAAQEADLISPGFEQSTASSNRSTLDFTLHCGEQRIVLPDDASWKRLCSSSVPPDDYDDETAVGDIHQPFFYRYNTFENLTALVRWRRSQVLTLSKFWYFFPILQHKNFQHANSVNIRHEIAM